MQETVHQSPVFNSWAQAAAGHTGVRDGELRGEEEEEEFDVFLLCARLN